MHDKTFVRVGVLLVAASCTASCSLFGKQTKCSEGSQRCDGTAISTCVSQEQGLGNPPTYAWQKTSSCALMQPALVCKEQDGFAACVTATTLADGGLAAAGGGDGGSGTSASSSIFSDTTTSAPVAWTRVDVEADDAGTVHLASTTSALLNYAPPAPSQGQLAAVSYGAEGQPLSAALLALGAQGGASAWVRSDQATKVGLVMPDGREVASAAVGSTAQKSSAASSPSSANGALEQVASALTSDLPPTLDIVPAGQVLPPLSFLDQGPTLISVSATPELVGFVADALQRLPPFAASILTEVAFVDSAVHAFEVGEFDPGDGGGAAAITLASDAEDAGVSGGLLMGDASIAAPSWPFPAATHAAVNERAVLYVDASSSALDDYRRAPAELALEIVREIASLFVSMTTRSKLDEIVGLHFAFPQDYPASIAALLQDRVSPLLLPGEAFTDVWGGLHNIGVQAQLASPYQSLVTPTDSDALGAGFATGEGAKGPAEDFVEYAAHASVPELWTASPCPTLQSATLDTLDPRMFVHVAKLEALWGLGLLSGARLVSCLGDLATEPNPSGIVAHPSTGQEIAFDQNVLGQQEAYYQGQTQVALTADEGPADQAITAAFVVAATSATTGLFRLTSVSHRADPKLGAGFYFTKPSTSQKTEAAAGLLLITRVDDQVIEGHALLVQQGLPMFAAPLVGTPVLPLITAHYDLPLDPSP